MKTEVTSLDAPRHQLLEGVLLRLARCPDAAGLVLRGGMLLRHWFGSATRPALDLDLVAASSLTVEEATQRYLPLFADHSVGDGVIFDVEQYQFEAIWQHTNNPGVRLHICGVVGDDEVDIQVDITGGPWPQPAPVFGELPTTSGQPARVWMCRPEAIVGQKLQALFHLGTLGWRPKDLNDLRMLLERLPLDLALLREAIVASFAELGGTGEDARKLFGASAWWGMKLTAARWQEFVDSSRSRVGFRSLSDVVATVADRLAPILEGLP